jgi:hypothetical protein
MEQGTEGGKEMKTPTPEGWPTEEMIEAGLLEMLGRPFDKMVPVRESVEGIFKAMLAAAPPTPTPTPTPTPEWSDSDLPLPEDREIEATHPLVTGRFDLDQEAMRLVSAKHSKFALVALVRWLLTKAEPLPAQGDEPYAYALVSENHNTLIWARDKKVVEVCREKYPNGKFIELFSRPQSDKLREVAEEALDLLEGSVSMPESKKAVQNLRDALKKERS